MPTHSTSVGQAERDLVNALGVHLTRLMDHESTPLQLDDFPTVRALRLRVCPVNDWVKLF